MELIYSYDSLGGQHIELYGGIIEPQELQLNDELHLKIGERLLVCSVTEIDNHVELDVYLGSGRARMLGRHALTNAKIDGRWPETSERTRLGDQFVPRRKPFAMGYRFIERVQSQGVDTEGLDLEELGAHRVRKGFPVVVRRSNV